MKSFRILKERRTLIAQCLVIICAMLAIGFVSTRAAFDNQSAVQDAASGAPMGETIDLTSFRSKSGKTLAETVKGRSVALVVLVRPGCETCTLARDTFASLKDRVAQPGIPYFVVMIPESRDIQKYFSYADSLNLDAESFVWSNTESKPPRSFATLAVPSHLLVTNEGLVVNMWFGAEPK